MMIPLVAAASLAWAAGPALVPSFEDSMAQAAAELSPQAQVVEAKLEETATVEAVRQALPPEAELLQDVDAKACDGGVCRDVRFKYMVFGKDLDRYIRPDVALQQGSTPSAEERKEKKRDGVYLASIGYAWGAAAFDLKTTMDGIDCGGREVGAPRIFGDRNKPGIAVAAVGFQTAFALLNHFALYKRGHKTTAKVLNFVNGSVHIGAGIHNRGICR